MPLTATDLALVRDEVGTATPPTDTELNTSYDELGHWILVALRVLKRRRAAATSGSTADSFSLAGVFSVSMKASIRDLDGQIARLQGEYEAETGVDLPGGAQSLRLTRTARR